MGACPFTVNESPAKLGSPGNDGICAPELAPMVETAGCRLTLLMLTGGNSVASQSEAHPRSWVEPSQRSPGVPVEATAQLLATVNRKSMGCQLKFDQKFNWAAELGLRCRLYAKVQLKNFPD